MDRMLKNGKKIRMARPKRKSKPFRSNDSIKVRLHQIKTWFSLFIKNFEERGRRAGKKWMVRIKSWVSQFQRKYPEVIKIKRATLISLIVFAILLSSFFSIMLVSCISDGDQPIETTVPPNDLNIITPTVTSTPTVTQTSTPEPLPDHK